MIKFSTQSGEKGKDKRNKKNKDKKSKKKDSRKNSDGIKIITKSLRKTQDLFSDILSMFLGGTNDTERRTNSHLSEQSKPKRSNSVFS